MLSLESLIMLTLSASVASMLLACAALWPYSKDGMASIRDAVLWSAFAFVGVGVVTVGLRKIQDGSIIVNAPVAPAANRSFEFEQPRMTIESPARPLESDAVIGGYSELPDYRRSANF